MARAGRQDQVVEMVALVFANNSSSPDQCLSRVAVKLDAGVLEVFARSIVIFSGSRFSKITLGKEARNVVRGLSEMIRMRCCSSRR